MLVNDAQQYTVWPGQLAVPSGWRVVHRDGSSQSCLAYVRARHTDLSPLNAHRYVDLVPPSFT